jgi:predicted metal-dependent hydrolase
VAFKEYVLDDQTTITVYKRAGSKSLRLSITSTGKVRVTIPTWTPYQAGLRFARSRMEWIARHQEPVKLLASGQPVGKAHHLKFVAQPNASRVSSRVMAGQIVVGHPPSMTGDDDGVQKVARTACIRALRRQAEQLLPQRLETVAAKHGFSYTSVSIKQLKSRWGSCDQSQNIVFNLYLLQLPWQLIDYVIIHELIHTRVLHHGPEFWQLFESVLPTAKQIRKEMGQYQPVLFTPGPELQE